MGRFSTGPAGRTLSVSSPFYSCMGLSELGEYIDEGELTPEFVKAVIGFTVAFLVVGGLITYYVTFVLLGF